MTNSPRALLRAMRPKQWVKNVLVAAAPFAAGAVVRPDIATATVLAMLAFTLVSAGVYLLNDVRDVESDRAHPTKRLRPIAAGEVTRATAVGTAIVVIAAGVALGFLVAAALAVVLAVYLVIQALYSVWLKDEPVLDLAAVASGFMLRAIAGGVACGLPLSQWFLLVAGFGSLFVVAGKRYSEFVTLGPDAGTRNSLRRYTATYLRFMWATACSVVIMSYSLWAFAEHPERPWAAISIAPFTLGVLRYGYDIDSGGAGSPEDTIFRDRTLLALGALWLVSVGLAVFEV